MTFTGENSGLIGDTVTSIAFDGDGSKWVAARQGVAKLAQTGWVFYNNVTYMPSNQIWDMDYTNGSLWIAHYKGITGFDGSAWTTYTEDNSGLVNTPVLGLAPDNQGNLWFGTARGLGRLSYDKVWTSYKRENTPAMPYDGIEALTTDASNTVWMSFIGTAGLVGFPAGNSANAKYIKQDSIAGFPKGAVYIISLAVDWNGNLWAGTKKNGAIRINEGGASVFSKSIPAIKDSNVHTVAVDQCGNVWIGTDAGAAMYNGKSWRDFGQGTGLLNDTVNIIRVDGAGHIWFGTKGGLTVFKPLPNAVELISPLENMTMNYDTVTTRWAWACPGIMKYWYEIADNPNFTNSIIDTTSPSLMQSATKLNTGLQNNTTYYWRVRAQNDAGWGPFSPVWIFFVSFPSSVSAGEMTSSGCELMQNYPNPSSGKTTIEFTMTRRHPVSLGIYDMLGRQRSVILNAQMGPGRFSIPVDVSSLLGGVYIYRLKAGNDMLQRTMHIVR